LIFPSIQRIFHIAPIALCVTLSGQANAADVNGMTQRQDGSSIHWTLDKTETGDPKRILLIAHGSGCKPARASRNVTMLAELAKDFSILTVEKYDVSSQEGASQSDTCSDGFYQNHTVTRRVEDTKLVLSDLKRDGHWAGDLAVFGGSEGGAVVSVLASEVEEVDAVVVLSTGTGLTLEEYLPMVVPPPVAEQMRSQFAALRANPKKSVVIGGNSNLWWLDILERRLSQDLLQSESPILLVHVTKDQYAPVASARATQEAFSAAPNADRLTYWEMEGLDHDMVDEEGTSHMASVLSDVVAWLNQTLAR
jgi:alpha-beta hydrolase superfamily lysophospholipase